jgi:hypothetical protein
MWEAQALASAAGLRLLLPPLLLLLPSRYP